MKDLGSEHGNRWELDYNAFTAYKMPSLRSREEDPDGYAESVASNAILLADEEGKATPAHEFSPILQTLGGPEKPGILRLFFHPDLQKAVDGLLNDLKFS